MNEPPTERECRYCHAVKPLDQFRPDVRAKYGRTWMCRDCATAEARERRKTPIVRAKEAKRVKTDEGRRNARERMRRYRERKRKGQKATVHRGEYTPEEIEASKAKHKQHRQKNKQKVNARYALNNALRKGKITKPETCFINNNECHGQIEAHHPDYSKPLDVIWLCNYHHDRLHIEKKEVED